MARLHRVGFGLVLLGAVTFATATSAEPRKACPPGQRPSVDGCIEGSRHARARSVDGPAKSAQRTQSVPAPDIDSGLDPQKRARIDTSRRHLLILELQQLEHVFAATPAKAADRPNIIRRLAEGYAELEAISERERIEQELLAEAAKIREAADTRANDTEAPRSTRTRPLPRKRSTTRL